MPKTRKKKMGRPLLNQYIDAPMTEQVKLRIHKQMLSQIQEINTAGSVQTFIREAIAEKLRNSAPYDDVKGMQELNAKSK